MPSQSTAIGRSSSDLKYVMKISGRTEVAEGFCRLQRLLVFWSGGVKNETRCELFLFVTCPSN